MNNTKMYHFATTIYRVTEAIAFFSIVIAMLAVDSGAYLEILCLLGIGALFGLAAFLSKQLSFFYKREMIAEAKRAARKKRRVKYLQEWSCTTPRLRRKAYRTKV